MRRHVVDRVAEYLAGELSPEELDAFRRHLAECPDCAADVSWAERARRIAMAGGAAHVAASRIVAISEGAAAEPAERAHLESCPACREELEWMRSPVPSAAPEAGGERTRRLWIPWTLATAAALAAVVMLPDGPAFDPADLADPQPLSVPTARSPADRPAALTRGLEAYRAGDWAVAADSLAAALRHHPEDQEVALYLASAELLGGRAAAAAARLEPLTGSADRILREEATWMLIHADLARGRTDRARSGLQTLADGPGAHAEAARALLDRWDREGS
ncbi:MAG TPA: zf-HC2 domain-containing protein [bacterium]|nr:zf-HC2 domain-containing protein [bacterium]